MVVGPLNDAIKQIFLSIASNSDFDIEVMESDINHIHFLIRYIPRWSISQLVRRLKQESTRQIWLLHSTSLRKEYWYKDMFWSDGYFVCSIDKFGGFTAQTVQLLDSGVIFMQFNTLG